MTFSHALASSLSTSNPDERRRAEGLEERYDTMLGFALAVPIIAKCAGTTPVETLTPDVIFIPNEIEMFDRLHVSYHHRRRRNAG